MSLTQKEPTIHSNGLRWKRLAIFASLFVALTLAGFYTVFEHFSGRSLTFDTRLLAPEFLVSMAAVLVVYFAADGLRLYYTLVALGVRIPAKAMTKLVFINIFFSNITPLATGGGFAQVWYLHDHGVSVGRSSAATVIRTVLAVFFIFSLTPVALLTLPALQNSELSRDISSTLAWLTAAYLGFFIIVLRRTRWLITPTTAVIQLLFKWHVIKQDTARRWYFRVMREMLKFSRSFSAYLQGSPVAIICSVLYTAIFLLALFSVPAVIMWGLGYDVPYITSLGLLLVTTFIMYFAPTPGASGISEGVFGSFFSQLLEHQHLLLVTFSWRLLTIYLGMIIGLVVLQRYLVQRGLNNPALQ